MPNSEAFYGAIQPFVEEWERARDGAEFVTLMIYDLARQPELRRWLDEMIDEEKGGVPLQDLLIDIGHRGFSEN
jgi:hypothetical protein